MGLTKAQADAELVDRRKAWLQAAGKSIVVDGTNPDTVGPLREGLASLGYGVASYSSVADSDLTAVQEASYPQLFDVAELRLLRNIHGSLADVDQKISLGSQSLSQLPDRVLAAIKDLESKCKDQHGVGLGSVTAGTIDLGFAQTDPCDTTELWRC